LGSGSVGRWAGGPSGGIRVYSLDLNLIGLIKFKSHTFEVANGKFQSSKSRSTIPNPVYPQKFLKFTNFVKQPL
jgi:hypothetical protein